MPVVDDHTNRVRWPDKVDIIGLGVSLVDYATAVEAIAAAASANTAGIVSCHAVHAVVTLTSTPELRRLANQFSMITPDGQPVRWAMNVLHRAGLRDRVYGPELMLRLCERAQTDQLPIYLYGGDELVSQRLYQQLTSRFPQLKIAGAEAPPFRPLTPTEETEVVDRINGSGARLIFIGLGCPKQDLFAFRHRHALKGIQICVGAAFDFHAGVKSMAPGWMQRFGLEWLYRLYQEPRRLARRYLTTNTIFVWRVVRQWLVNQTGKGSSN